MNVMIPFKLFYLLYQHFVLDTHDREDEIRRQITVREPLVWVPVSGVLSVLLSFPAAWTV